MMEKKVSQQKLNYINIQVLQQKDLKDEELFEKKPDIGRELIHRILSRGLSPGIVLIDGGYGNNTTFLKKNSKKGN